MLRVTYQGQTYLQESMASLKETNAKVHYENKGGLCHGIAIAGLLAFFCGDIGSYNKRIDYIYRSHQQKKNLKNEIALLQQKLIREKRTTLSSDEYVLLSTWGFFDSVSLYQSPDKHETVLGKELHQSESNKVAEFIASHAIQNLGGLKKVESWNGHYELADLKTYLEELTATAKKCNQSIGLFLNTGPMNREHPHATSLCWDQKKQQWLFINANGLPTQEFTENELDSLAEVIFAGFWDKDVTGFETILYTTGNNEGNTKHFLRELKKTVGFQATHQPSERKKERVKQWDLLNKVCDAVNEDKVSVLQQLVTKNVNLNQPDVYFGKTPLFLAVELEHIDCVQTLLPHVSVNQILQNGQTVLHKAVKTQNVEMIKLLIGYGADVTIADTSGLSPLDLMLKYNDNEEIVKLFIQHCESSVKLAPLFQSFTHNTEITNLLITKFKSLNVQGKHTPIPKNPNPSQEKKHHVKIKAQPKEHLAKEAHPAKHHHIKHPHAMDIEQQSPRRVNKSETYNKFSLFSEKRRRQTQDEFQPNKKVKYTLV